MRIIIDPDKCQGHALCWREAETLVTLDDYGFAQPRATTLAPEDRELAERAAVNCPERAIIIED